MINMIVLTPQLIIEIHDIIIELDKGTSDYIIGVRDIGTLEYLTEYQINLENDIFRNAAYALHSITDKHIFNNGNKRTGFGIATIILESERYHITANRDNRLKFLLKIARYETTIEEIEKWLRENSCRMGKIRFLLHSFKNMITDDTFIGIVELITIFKNVKRK